MKPTLIKILHKLPNEKERKKKNKQGIHNHTGQKPGAPTEGRRLFILFTYTNK